MLSGLPTRPLKIFSKSNQRSKSGPCLSSYAPVNEAVADNGEAFAQMDNSPELGANLAPIHAAILFLIANGSRSFHLQGDSPPTAGGAGLAQLDNAFGKNIKQGLCDTCTGSIA